MDSRVPLFRTPSLTVTPSGAGRGYTVEVKDSGGAAVASCDAEGMVRDQTGEVLLAAPIRWQGRGDRPTDAGIQVADGGGRPLGTGRVVKYGIGPRARKATISFTGPDGAEAARLEPRDKKGEQLAMVSNGTELATVGVEVVKRGFLRKSRVYTVDLAGDVPAELRPLVVAASIRYDAVLNAVVSAAARD